MSISFCIFVFACVFVCICVIRNCSNMRVPDRACAHHDLQRYMYLHSSVQWVAVGGDENNLSSFVINEKSWTELGTQMYTAFLGSRLTPGAAGGLSG